MLFNSYIFILAFFPIALILYYILNHSKKYKLAQGVLIVMSLGFYAYFHLWYLFVLIGSIVVNWFLSRTILGKRKKYILVVGIILNISVIFVFKYYNFFLENINYIFKSTLPLLNILMPLGISFFTFQQISYLIDSFRGETQDYSFLEYALFVCFFPQLIAGPIVLHQEMIPQFRNVELKTFNNEKFAKGIYLFAVGLVKKVLLADTISVGVDWGYANLDSIGGLDALLVVILYSFQLYFDFSGYCDMACGIARCFNFELPVNFLSPYKAISIGDFWKRWHITLTRFLTKYVYIPLGGSKKGKIRTLINIMLVFLISGLWHGANWTYVIWGAMHGIAMMIDRLADKYWNKIVKPVRICITYVFVAFAWVPFRAANLSDAIKMLTNIFLKPEFNLSNDFCASFDMIEFTYFEEHISIFNKIITRFPSIHLWIILGISAIIIFFTKNCHEKEFVARKGNAVITVGLLIWSIMSLAGMSTFLYFNF